LNLLDQAIEDYCHGVLSISRDRNGVRLRRMTPDQFAYYDRNPGWAIRSRCNSGGSIALRTDSRFMDITLHFLSGARTYFGLDIEIDGIHSHCIRLDKAQGSYERRLFEFDDSQERTVRIYLSPNIEIKLLKLELKAGSTLQPIEPAATNLLCLGDSITQGMDAISPVSTYPVQLARMLNANLLNQGVGGHIFDLDALDPDLPFDPDLITVAYGTNDWGREIGLDGVRNTASAYLEKLREIYPPPVRIVVLSPIWREIGHEQRGGVDLPTFSRTILETALTIQDLEVIDGLALVPNQPWHLEDGTHPNDLGFLHYSLNLYRLLTAK
jgi:lysophospholipase L1-like esterase